MWDGADMIILLGWADKDENKRCCFAFSLVLQILSVRKSTTCHHKFHFKALGVVKHQGDNLATWDANIEPRDVFSLSWGMFWVYFLTKNYILFFFFFFHHSSPILGFRPQSAFGASYSWFFSIILLIGGEISHVVPGRLHTSKESVKSNCCQVQSFCRETGGLEDAISILSDESWNESGFFFFLAKCS